MAEDDLNGTRVAVLIAPRGTEEPEFVEPRDALVRAGASVTIVGIEAGTGETVNNDLDPGCTYDVDSTVGDVSVDDFDAVVVPGGAVGADKLRASPDVAALLRAFADARKPMAVICHAPWVLIEAGLAKGRRLTSFPSLRTDLENAGAVWVDEEVVIDDGLITSRDPSDLPAFTSALTSELATSPASARSH